MPRRPKTQATQSPQSNALPPIQHALSTRQQREVLRYAANFAVDTAAVVREIQAAMSPALEHAVMGLVAASDGYEKARADHDRSLRGHDHDANIRPCAAGRVLDRAGHVGRRSLRD